jgi:hypothetical protein
MVRGVNFLVFNSLHHALSLRMSVPAEETLKHAVAAATWMNCPIIDP